MPGLSPRLPVIIWMLLLVLLPLQQAPISLSAQVADLTHIVVISVDGLRPDAVQQAQMPTLQRLARDGAVSWTAETVFPPATLPAHTSMLTGITPDEHGVIWNSYTPLKINAPTFLTVAQDAGYNVAMSVGKEKLHQLDNDEAIAYEFARQGDRSVVDAALNQLDNGAEILFVHLPNTDYFGHSRGWMSETYLYELRNTDAQIERLVTAFDERDLLASTLFIITSDHGGSGTDHGSDIPEDMQVPLILYGAGVDPGTALGDDDTLYTVEQVAPTVLWALGIDHPREMSDPITAAFAVSSSMPEATPEATANP